MKVLQCVQGTPEWLQARAGRVTASRVGDALSFLKRGDKQGTSSASREAYKAEIVAEILTGMCSDHYVSPYMERGTQLEPFARAAYEMRYDVMIDQVGFVIHPTIERSGASPDGLIRGIRGVEFKCPKIETHLKWMLAGVVPAEHEPQLSWNLACAPEYPEWEFASFCPELPERHQLFVVPMSRNEDRIAEMEAGVRKFLAEVDETVEALNQINPEIASSLAEDPMAWASGTGLDAETIDKYIV